jgi:K+:H+ antiporter
VFWLIRWANDKFVSEVPVITTILVVTGIMALITDAIGVHTVLGAFVAGILVGQSPILTRHIDEQLRGLITALFMPVFFGMAGLNADLRVLGNPSLLLLALGFIAIASLGKFSGAFIGGAIGGLTWRESLALGWGMNARGSTEVIVASLGLSMGALSQDLFTIIVAMAVVTTMAMPPMPRWALAAPAAPPRRKSADRTRRVRSTRLRQQYRTSARSHRPERERPICLAPGGAALRLTTDSEHCAAAVSATPPTGGQARAFAEETVAPIIKDVAEAAEIESVHTGRTAPSVDITTLLTRADGRSNRRWGEEGLRHVALIVGVEPAVAVQSEIDEKVARVSQAFDGPLAIAVARGSHREEPAAATHLNTSSRLPVLNIRDVVPRSPWPWRVQASLRSRYCTWQGGDGRPGGMACSLASALIGEASVATKKRSCATPVQLRDRFSACRCEPPSACTPTRRRPSCSS